MPFGRARRPRRGRKRDRKRPSRRRRYKRKRRTPTLQVGMPLKHTCKLRYTEVISLDASAGTNTSYSFRCNNVFDPDATGTGHQPRHYDLLAEVYNLYTVRGMKISAKIVGFDETALNRTQVLGIRVSPDFNLATPNTDIAALHECGRTMNTRYTMVNHQDPTRTRVVNHYWSLAKTKSNNPTDTDDVLTGTTGGAGPSRQDYATIFVGHAITDPGQDPCRLQIMVTCDYVVQFRGVKGNLPED